MDGTLRVMSLICARLSCGVAAAASVQFDADLAQVVIIDLSDTTVGIPLCHEHTRTRTPPVGWTLIDARGSVRQGVMLDTPSTAPAEPPPIDGDGPGSRPARRRPVDRGFVWERLGASDASAGAVTESEQAEPTDESDELPNAATDDEGWPTSPLLSRAFRAAHSDRVD